MPFNGPYVSSRPDWDAWLTKSSGKRIAARKPGDGNLEVPGDAPGTYVHAKD